MVAAPDDRDRPYRMLRVPPEASDQQIRRAYRKLAHDLHPDTNPQDPEAARRFQEITEAYELLSNAKRRARYDRQRQSSGSSAIPADGEAAAAPGLSVPGPGRWVGTTRPTVIGAGPVRLGAIPLVVGPVRVAASSGADGHLAQNSVEVTWLIDAIREVWGLK